MGDKGSFNGCSFLWVTNAGAAEITANSIASLQRHLRKGGHSLFVGTLDAASEQAVSTLTDCSDVQFFRLDQENSWRAGNIEVPSEYVNWDTQDFRLICKAKYFGISKILRETGRPVLFADGDIAFLKNPVEFFEMNRAVDGSRILAQNDRDVTRAGNDLNVQHPPGHIPDGNVICAGFTAWQPTRAHLKIAEHIGRRVTGDRCDQTVFNKLSFWRRRHVQLLPLEQFPNGSLAFGKHDLGRPDIDLRDPYIVHANWRVGMDNKIKVLKDGGYWFV
ncbi:putative nucleotide-diphospho-sugar transferase [Hoeflea prorocentri]|uniref:Nucleotide-diphospho-sugar transferase n=1 Tax=Hoeflea prorocentri TaxID=1922333 RepID=A0A9X3UKE2_9HYPH|nr:putative nucleotide-diphospho-sugar transferase [Hoeflea prorocentri]MCY6382196.1 putative nucleotide-diphospho-sugar transferase [Hoeflea prorocentri]MDA5399996.1 putative nucleotide-diphospho-sugar transferase [Hoeflea prorocentri]